MAVLVLQSFGNEKEYIRAVFTMFSYVAKVTSPASVMLYTDCPDFFNPYVAGLSVQFIPLTVSQLTAMRGEMNFLHRIKIAVIEDAFKRVNENLVYADSDTFFTENPEALLQQVSPTRSFMHVHEYTFESMRDAPLPAGAPIQDFLKLIDRHKFVMKDGSSMVITPDLSSWNAGVLMLHPTHRSLIPDVYLLTDQIFRETQNHASEQYAFSVLLQKHTLLGSCSKVVYHYWYRIEKNIMDNLLAERITPSWATRPLSEKIRNVADWSGDFPSRIQNHSWLLKDRAIQAFHENKFRKGYQWAADALLKTPFDIPFIKEVLYHTRRLLTKQS